MFLDNKQIFSIIIDKFSYDLFISLLSIEIHFWHIYINKYICE